MLTREQLTNKANENYLDLKGQGISNAEALHRIGYIEGYAKGWKEAANQDYSFASALQHMIDDCDITAFALLRARGHGCAELARMRGKQKGLEEALALIFPEYKNKRVFLLNEQKHNKAIQDLAKQYEDEDHERWIREERGQ